MGFRVTGRSERDDQGGPYPILHMKLWPHDQKEIEYGK